MKTGTLAITLVLAPAHAAPLPLPLTVTPQAYTPLVAGAPGEPEVTGLELERPRERGKTTGWELGVRTGYGLPIGKADGGTAMGDLVNAMVPFWIDAGFRSTPYSYVGVFFEYGLDTLNTDAGKPLAGCTAPNLNCSSSNIRVGLDLHLYFTPMSKFDPWLGVASGLEVTTFSASSGGVTNSIRALGIEYMNLQLGADWNATPWFALGPFVSISLDQYQTIDATIAGEMLSGAVADKTLHSWLLLGVRAVFDVALHGEPPSP